MAFSPISRTGISSKEIVPAALTSQWVSSTMTGNRHYLLQLLIWSVVLPTPAVSLNFHPGMGRFPGAGRIPLAPVPVAVLKMMKIRIARSNRRNEKSVVTECLRSGKPPKHCNVLLGARKRSDGGMMASLCTGLEGHVRTRSSSNCRRFLRRTCISTTAPSRVQDGAAAWLAAS